MKRIIQLVLPLLLNMFCLAQTGTFTDARDGNVYKWVRIGDQVWMAENLKYANTIGGTVFDDTYNGSALVNGHACYQNDDSFCERFGRLYNFYAARESCPPGWRLPLTDEIKTMLDYLTTKADNVYESLLRGGHTGFDALFAGNHFYFEGFNSFGVKTCWWTYDADLFEIRGSYHDSFGYFTNSELIESWGNYAASVRCLLDTGNQ